MAAEEPTSESAAAQFLTTEHFALQGARAATISDSNGRSSLFVSTLSSSLVAFGFIGQATQMGELFFVFAFVLLPTLLFLGLVTFDRLLQSGIEDMIYARGINRIRHFYTQRAPETKTYFVMSDRDDNAGFQNNMGIESSRFQVFLTNAGVISVVNGVILGVLVGLIVHVVFGWSTAVNALCGGVAGVVLIALETRHQLRSWTRADRKLPVLFPSDAQP